MWGWVGSKSWFATKVHFFLTKFLFELHFTTLKKIPKFYWYMVNIAIFRIYMYYQVNLNCKCKAKDIKVFYHCFDIMRLAFHKSSMASNKIRFKLNGEPLST